SHLLIGAGSEDNVIEPTPPNLGLCLFREVLIQLRAVVDAGAGFHPPDRVADTAPKMVMEAPFVAHRITTDKEKASPGSNQRECHGPLGRCFACRCRGYRKQDHAEQSERGGKAKPFL